jgi:galactoside O-acetyltransferase
VTLGFLDQQDLAGIGFAAVGRNVLISERASIYGAERISIGDNVRIDDFCILSAGEGGIDIGSNIHIAAYTSLIGAGRISVRDFANFSSRVAVYSSSDDYSGESMTNPMVPEHLKKVDVRPVHIGRHVIIGCGSVILPGATLHEGAAIGALSVVKGDCEAFGIYAGSPLRRLGDRSRKLLDLEGEFRTGEGP